MMGAITGACAVVCVGCEYAECDGDGNAGVGDGCV